MVLRDVPKMTEEKTVAHPEDEGMSAPSIPSPGRHIWPCLLTMANVWLAVLFGTIFY